MKSSSKRCVTSNLRHFISIGSICLFFWNVRPPSVPEIILFVLCLSKSVGIDTRPGSINLGENWGSKTVTSARGCVGCGQHRRGWEHTWRYLEKQQVTNITKHTWIGWIRAFENNDSKSGQACNDYHFAQIWLKNMIQKQGRFIVSLTRFSY